MHIVFTTEGGFAFFPGLSRPDVIDSHDLSAAEADELERLLDRARFFELPEDSQHIAPRCGRLSPVHNQRRERESSPYRPPGRPG